ncbi:MAG TPA: undecaprenyldiphospho-muramoylpentapeptide beta-N-acetylglucosaminyltransferase [Terriglobales bacterium]|nr:undecaprenyldiphospho-muramoylpentapeptide beta-N-acetylglucosaminyltransferase [Terriglobales bacterium]
MRLRAILAGGGTGGHVIPALAIAGELRSHLAAEVIFIGTARGMETRLVPRAGFELKLVEVGALNRVSAATKLRTLLDLPRAIWTAGRYISEFRAGVVIGVGGYASGPAMIAAAALGVPTVAFEPNVVPGFANRRMAPMLAAACVQFEESCRNFRNCYVTGIPVRPDFFRVPPRPPAGPPTLLVFGGSQGARRINEVLLESLESLYRAIPNLVIMHQTGERDYESAQAAYLHVGVRAEVSPFIDNMPEAFARADLLLCRSGASTAAEVMAAGKPAIFVPFPQAADDHQMRNAEALARMNAAVVIRQADLAPATLTGAVSQLLGDPARLRAMGVAARQHAHPNAARDIATIAARVSR